MTWNESEVQMKDPGWLSKDNTDKFEKELFMIHGPDSTDAETMQCIMELECAKADLKPIIQDKDDLKKEQQQNYPKFQRV